MSIKSVMQSNHFLHCQPFLLLPSIFPSIMVFSSGSALCIWWPKYWSFSFSISPSNEYSGLTGSISLLSKGPSRVFSSTTIQKNQFCGTQPYLWSNFHTHMTTGKTTALIIWTFVSKLMSLLFKTLSRFVIAFLPRRKYLLISCSHCSDFGGQENKICHCFHFSPIYLLWSDGTICHDLLFLNAEF